MVKVFQIVTLFLVAVAMALSLAHALEFPGKMRLSEEDYLTVQQIYYPGFTYGGFSEVGGIVALAILLFLVPFAGAQFWWVAASLALLSMSHLTYWLFTHPVNGFWLKDVDLTGLGGAFFSTFTPTNTNDWTKLRDVWEYSHVARAFFAMFSFISASIALSF